MTSYKITAQQLLCDRRDYISRRLILILPTTSIVSLHDFYCMLEVLFLYASTASQHSFWSQKALRKPSKLDRGCSYNCILDVFPATSRMNFQMHRDEFSKVSLCHLPRFIVKTLKHKRLMRCTTSFFTATSCNA